ncbi:MAG: aminotransferase [Flavobacteriaceae bacterium]|nr:aminotransferase [Flavobacteriaceae bacterium]|tara:strand:- start:22613 stop:23683 length:1071 start_codon:yes stop_codon:yes gene_type:complete
MNAIRNEFQALAEQTYLNTPASGLLSRSLAAWRQQHEAQFLSDGSNYAEAIKLLESVRNTLGRFFGTSSDTIALVPNFSLGFNVLLESLSKGQKILLLENDYPSVNWPVEHRDFDVCYAKVDTNLEKNIETAVAEHRPDLFVFSQVQWLNGLQISEKFLQQLKAYHPEMLLIADGTQYLGTEPFSFQKSAVDVMGCSAYKWLLSGYGNGFFMIKEEARSKIFPATIGFNSSEGFDSPPSATRFMKHWEPGHLDPLNFGSLGNSLTLMEQWNNAEMNIKAKKLAFQARAAFIEKGLLSEAYATRSQHAPFFNIEGDQKVFDKLKAEKIVVSQRGGGIRVGFHFYNTEEDLNRLLDVL